MKIEREGLLIDHSVTGQGLFTLLFIHGSFINKDYWESQVDYFKDQYRIVAIDLPGHGHSGRNRNDWSIEAYGRDVVAVIDQLRLDNIILIGHSMGADAMLEAAVARKNAVVGCVAIDYFKNAGSPLPEKVQQEIDNILGNLQKDFPATSEQYARQGLLTKYTEPSITDRVVKDYREAWPGMGIANIKSVFSYWKRERELLQQLSFKLYLLNCNYLPTNEKALHSFARSGYEIVPIQATSHFPMIEVPNHFNQQLGITLEKITAKKMSMVTN